MRAFALAFLVALLGCAPDHPTVSLDHAVSTGCLELVEAHLYWCREEGGCDLNVKLDKFGNSHVHSAAHEGHAEGLKAFVGAGANVKGKTGRRTLVEAALEGHSDVVRILLDAGVDVKSERGKSALHAATEMRHADIVRILLDAGATHRE